MAKIIRTRLLIGHSTPRPGGTLLDELTDLRGALASAQAELDALRSAMEKASRDG